MGPMFQASGNSSRNSATASQMPKRTVRRTMRRSLAPIACDAIGATAPRTVGTCMIGPPFAFAISAPVIGLSDAPKSTVLSESCRMPPPEPIDW